MYNIAIIGAGQLGSRHLQGLKLIPLETNIYIVDISSESLEIAQNRYNEVEENFLIKSFNICHSIDQLPEFIDLVIIATSSIPRIKTTKELLETKSVKYIVFEKILFPSIKDYQIAQDLLNNYNVKSWVNCPRRMFSHFKQISAQISKSERIDFHYIGLDWGLACNSIHFFDLFSFFTEETQINYDLSLLEPVVFKSKRAGYVEFMGTIKGYTPNGSTITLSSLKNTDGSDLNDIIVIKGANLLVEVNEPLNNMIINKNITPIITPRQSQITGMMAEQIVLNGISDLTTFEESAQIHTQFLTPLINFYNKINSSNIDYCPIT